MQYNLITIKNIYSKGILDRKVGGFFVIYKPYMFYTHYRYVRMMKNNCSIDVHLNKKSIGIAYVVNVKKIHKSEIDQNDLWCISKQELCEMLGIHCNATKVVLKWMEVKRI